MLEILGLVSAKIQLFAWDLKTQGKNYRPGSRKVSEPPLQLIQDLSELMIETIYQSEGKYV